MIQQVGVFLIEVASGTDRANCPRATPRRGEWYPFRLHAYKSPPHPKPRGESRPQLHLPCRSKSRNDSAKWVNWNPSASVCRPGEQLNAFVSAAPKVGSERFLPPMAAVEPSARGNPSRVSTRRLEPAIRPLDHPAFQLQSHEHRSQRRGRNIRQTRQLIDREHRPAREATEDISFFLGQVRQ